MVDRISNLPDELLFHILSFLPTEDVFVTSLVSKRWRPLRFSVTDLHFVELRNRNTHLEPRVPRYSAFIKFVDAFILRRGIHQPIKTLRLECYSCPVFKVEKWLKAAADCKVENLQICGPVLPCTIFSIKTLVVLKLRCVDFKGFSDVELPLLKTLHLDYVTFSKCQHFIELLNGCPLLENLEAKCISAAFVDDPKFTTLSKLVRADVFNLRRPLDIPMRTFCNVEFLRIDQFCDVDIPIFPNLIQLELMFGRHDLKWESVLDMLNHCPQLQTFDLENPSYTADKVWPNTHVVPKCFSSQLRTCILRNFKGKESGMRFAKFVMQNSALLDTMTIFSYRHLSLEEILEMRKELDSCPRSSASCELLFK
ncbi:F-box/LRR-repeat protein At3g59200-like [Lotus japonicus]|uniref:F-box/LRR-repeat protein At3g59200-like n=1 Tax=Lotus japonicus TaxID=34305 RepID=UPI00258A67E3|nr:F-box/LRR-repeat protein At3g59200-like [Lotus japonicus]